LEAADFREDEGNGDVGEVEEGRLGTSKEYFGIPPVPPSEWRNTVVLPHV
jgi:hypothetical protein